MKLKSQIMDDAAIRRALMRISHEITEKNKGVENLRLVGILRRGVPISRIICSNILAIENCSVPCGSLDIGFYRDDLSSLAENPLVRHAELPFDVNDSCGRPRSIQLAVLIDRGHRELPIRADYIGKNIPTSRSEMIEVRLPEYDGETGVFLMDLNA